MSIVLIAIVSILVLIGIQDMKERSFFTLTIPILFILALLYNYLLKEKGLSLSEWGMNLAYIGLSLTALQTYYFIKTKRFIPITQGAFAWGDVLLLLLASTLMSLKSLIITLLIASLVGLLFHFFSSTKNRPRGVPFAGILSLVIIPVILFQIWM